MENESESCSQETSESKISEIRQCIAEAKQKFEAKGRIGTKQSAQEELHNLLLSLLSAEVPKQVIQEICKTAMKGGVLQLLKEYFDIINKDLEGEHDHYYPLFASTKYEEWTCVVRVVMVFSDASTDFSVEVAKSNILEVVLLLLEKYKNAFFESLRQLRHKKNYALLQSNTQTSTPVQTTKLDVQESRYYRQLQDDERLVSFVTRLIYVLYNCSITRSNHARYKELNAEKLLKEYFNQTAGTEQISEDDIVCTCCMLSLAHVIGEGRKESMFCEPDGLVKLLLQKLKGALEEPDLRCANGFSADELVRGLQKLAMNDENSLTMLLNGLMASLVELVGRGDVEQQINAIKCMWALSFFKPNKACIRAKSEIIQLLKELIKNDNRKLKRAARGALWQLTKSQTERNDSGNNSESVTTETLHVMLSYNSKHQETVKKVKQELEKRGYEVWMDVDKMKGNLLEAMARAVEQASAVIICMSEAYKGSKYCRSEAEYAYDLGKPIIPLKMQKDYKPDGWLGILANPKVYCNFTEPSDFNASMEKLVKELEGKQIFARSPNPSPGKGGRSRRRKRPGKGKVGSTTKHQRTNS